MSVPNEWSRLLTDAQRAVNEASLDADLRPVAFGRVLDALAAQAALVRPPAPTSVVAAPVAGTSPSESEGAEHPLLAVAAQRLGVGLAMLQQIFEERSGDLELNLLPSMLPAPKTKASGIQAVALLMAGVRQVAGLEETTRWNLIREECVQLGVYDQSNFAAHIGKLEVKVSGRGADKAVRLHRHHLERVGGLVREIADESSVS